MPLPVSFLLLRRPERQYPRKARNVRPRKRRENVPLPKNHRLPTHRARAAPLQQVRRRRRLLPQEPRRAVVAKNFYSTRCLGQAAAVRTIVAAARLRTDRINPNTLRIPIPPPHIIIISSTVTSPIRRSAVAYARSWLHTKTRTKRRQQSPVCAKNLPNVMPARKVCICLTNVHRRSVAVGCIRQARSTVAKVAESVVPLVIVRVRPGSRSWVEHSRKSTILLNLRMLQRAQNRAAR